MTEDPTLDWWPQNGFCGQEFLCGGQDACGRHDNKTRTWKEACSSPKFKLHLEGDPEGSFPTRDGLSRWARMLNRSQPLLINDRRSDTRSTRCTPVDIRGSQAARS